MADLRALEDVCAFAEQKLSEIEGKHRSHLKWLAEKEQEIWQVLPRGAKDGAFKVPRRAQSKKVERPINDENAPPGQHAAAETPAVVKKGKNFQEEAASVLRKASRHQQSVLRDLSSNTTSEIRQPAKPPVVSTPLTILRPSTRNRPQLQQESVPVASNLVAEAPLSLEAPKLQESSLLAEPPTSLEDPNLQEQEQKGKVEPEAAKESEQLLESKAPAEEEIEPDQPVYKRRNKKQEKDSGEKDSSRKKKGLLEEENAASPAVEDGLPAVETSVADQKGGSHAAAEKGDQQKEERASDGPNPVASKAETAEKGSKGKEEAASESVANEEVAPQASGRVTRRMAKEKGVELSALPSGLADGSENGGRKKRRNRRREMDESAIREQTLTTDAKASEKEGAKGQNEEGPEKKESERDGAIREQTLTADAKASEIVQDQEESVQNEEGPDGKESVSALQEMAVETVTAVQIDEATIPETPQRDDAQRPQRATQAKQSNEEPPAGRITRNGRAKRTREKEASKERKSVEVYVTQETEVLIEVGRSDEQTEPDAEVTEGANEEAPAGKLTGKGRSKKAKVKASAEKEDSQKQTGEESKAEARDEPAAPDVPPHAEVIESEKVSDSEDEVLEKKRKGKKKPAKGKQRAKKGREEMQAGNDNGILPETTFEWAALPIANRGQEKEKTEEEELNGQEARESPVSTPGQEGTSQEKPTPVPRETRSASAKKAAEETPRSGETEPGSILRGSAAKETSQASPAQETLQSPTNEAHRTTLVSAKDDSLLASTTPSPAVQSVDKSPAESEQVIAEAFLMEAPVSRSSSKSPTAAVEASPETVEPVTQIAQSPAGEEAGESYRSPVGRQIQSGALKTKGSSQKDDLSVDQFAPSKEAVTPGSEGVLTRSQSKLQNGKDMSASPREEPSPNLQAQQPSPMEELVQVAAVENVSGVNKTEPESPPTVDMDVCTTPPTAGPKESELPTTENKKRKLSEKRVLRSATKADISSPPLRRSPRLQVTSTDQERSAKKMRLSEGFALTGELIDLENEDEDLMVEPNFVENSDGLRRSVRKKSPNPDQTVRSALSGERQCDLGAERSFRFSGSKKRPDKGIFQQLSAEKKAALRSATKSPRGEPSPPVSATDSEHKSAKKSALKSAVKSAHKRNVSGRPSFVSASEDAGFGGLASETAAGFGGLAELDAVQEKQRAKPSNLITSSISSLLSFMTKKEPAGPPIPGNNKNTVKGSVKALEAAELARKEEAKRAEEREKRKALLEKRKEEKQKELSVQVKAVPSKPVESVPEKKVAPTNHPTTVTDQKLRRAIEHRSKLEDEKVKKLEEDLRKKEEERRKKEADVMKRKRQREEEEKRERDEKRRRLEESIKSRKELGEKQRIEQEEKERKRKQQEETERKQKAAEEEERKRKRKEKELEAERRRKEDEEKRVAKAKEREEDRKRQEGLFVRRKEDERNDKLTRPGGPKPLTPIKTFLAENAASARHSPFTGADKMMPPPKTTPSSHALVENQYAAFSLTAGQAGRVLNPEHASSSLAAKPIANPPSNLRVANWDAAKKAQFGRLNLSRSETPPPPIAAVESYEISPYKEESDDEESEDERESKKPIPAWARKENLGPALRKQMGIDPDEVFKNMHVKTCHLDQVFGTKGSKKKKDFGRRSSSGNWLEDHLTWKEELQYKKGMGYI